MKKTLFDAINILNEIISNIPVEQIDDVDRMTIESLKDSLVNLSSLTGDQLQGSDFKF